MVTNNEVAKKIRLEKIFSRELIPLFTQILRDFRVNVAAFGVSQEAEQYEASFNGLLRNAYSRTQRAFKGDVAEANQISRQDIQAQTETILSIALIEWKKDNADDKSKIITDTNQRQMDKSIIKARSLLVENEEPETPLTLAATATALLRRQFNVRKNVISQTETQESAESTKLIEAQVLSGNKPFILSSLAITEPEEKKKVSNTWDTIGDDRVRKTHVAVDGVTIGESGIFIVGDSRLRFPGDTSLGASASEVVNCRCSSRYKLSE